MGKILHSELCYKITGLCFQLQKDLGRFCRERQYAEKFEEILEKNSLEYQREFNIKKLNPQAPSGNFVDFFIDNCVFVDFKAKNFITKEDYIQMQRYLQAGNIELGLIINFRQVYLKPKRVLNTKMFKDPK